MGHPLFIGLTWLLLVLSNHDYHCLFGTLYYLLPILYIE